jgi:hypothetical protein
MHLSDRHRMINAAADLVQTHKRGMFLMHTCAALDAEVDLTDRRFKLVLCHVLARFGISVGREYFSHGAPSRQHQQTTRSSGEENAPTRNVAERRAHT